MVYEKLNFTHRDLLFERLRDIDTQIAEYSFSNLYLFRDAHDYEVIIYRELFIKGLSHDGYTYLMPTRSITDIDRARLLENPDIWSRLLLSHPGKLAPFFP